MYYVPLVDHKPMYYLKLCHHQSQFLLPLWECRPNRYTAKELTTLALDNLMVKLTYRKNDHEATETMETLPKLSKQKGTANLSLTVFKK